MHIYGQKAVRPIIMDIWPTKTWRYCTFMAKNGPTTINDQQKCNWGAQSLQKGGSVMMYIFTPYHNIKKCKIKTGSMTNTDTNGKESSQTLI